MSTQYSPPPTFPSTPAQSALLSQIGADAPAARGRSSSAAHSVHSRNGSYTPPAASGQSRSSSGSRQYHTPESQTHSRKNSGSEMIYTALYAQQQHPQNVPYPAVAGHRDSNTPPAHFRPSSGQGMAPCSSYPHPPSPPMKHATPPATGGYYSAPPSQQKYSPQPSPGFPPSQQHPHPYPSAQPHSQNVLPPSPPLSGGRPQPHHVNSEPAEPHAHQKQKMIEFEAPPRFIAKADRTFSALVQPDHKQQEGSGVWGKLFGGKKGRSEVLRQ